MAKAPKTYLVRICRSSIRKKQGPLTRSRHRSDYVYWESVDPDVKTVTSVNRRCPVTFTYAPMQVQCCYCSAKFNSDELLTGGDYDANGAWTWHDNGCPVCKNSKCCNLKLEEIQDIIPMR